MKNKQDKPFNIIKFSSKDASFSEGYYRITTSILGNEKKFLGSTIEMVLDIANNNFNDSLRRHNESFAKAK